jgi:hypothetical protein
LKCLVVRWLGSAAPGAGMRKQLLDEGVAKFRDFSFQFSQT